MDSSSPRRSRSPSPPFPLRVPIQGPSFSGSMSFPHCMSYPIPFPSPDPRGHLDFLCPSPKFFIWITSSQWMFRICRKQQLTKVCSSEAVVLTSFHVSDPYNNADLTLLQKMWSLVSAYIEMSYIHMHTPFLRNKMAHKWSVHGHNDGHQSQWSNRCLHPSTYCFMSYSLLLWCFLTKFCMWRPQTHI